MKLILTNDENVQYLYLLYLKNGTSYKRNF